jgi:hypothetical protein
MKITKLLPVFLMLITVLSCSKKKENPSPSGNIVSSACTYSFSASNGSYTDLSNPTGSYNTQTNTGTLDPNDVPVPVGFNYTFFGKTTNAIVEISDYHIILWDSTNSYSISNGNYVYNSAIGLGMNMQYPDYVIYSWLTEGNPGSRIFKFQTKSISNQTDLNFQFWLYEGSNKIEFHWGQCNYLSSTTWDGTFNLGKYIYAENYYSTGGDQTLQDDGILIGLSGDPNNPTNHCVKGAGFNFSDYADNVMNGHPASGKIYSYY